MKDLDQLIESAVSSRKKEKGTPLDLNTLLEMTSEVVLENTQKKQREQKGNDFEVVVVQTVRSLSGADPLTGGLYEGWESKSEKTSRGKTLGEMAEELYTTASGSGFFTPEDFQNAKMQDIGKSPAFGKGSKIEIKTDVFFGDKPISIKMPGDTQADSSKISRLIDNVQSLTLDEEFDEEFKETFAELESKIIEYAKRKYLTDTRLTNIKNTAASEDPKDAKEAQRAQEILNAYKNLEIINDTGEIIKEELILDEAEIKKVIEEYLDKALKGDFGKLIKELLTGALAFQGTPGAAAEYLLSPEYAFDLKDEKTIEILSGAIKMRIALKGGRPLGIKEIDSIKRTTGSELTLRWDMKKNLLLEALEKAKIPAKQILSGEPPTNEAVAGRVEEESFEEIYDDIQSILLPIVENKNSK
jgi:hypothetical protein